MDRKNFIKVAGADSAAAAAAVGVPLAGALAASRDDNTFSLRAVAPLPQKPLPAYASHLVEGTVDLMIGTGIATSRVLAGHPEDTGIVGIPGLSRIIRITNASADGSRHTLTGLIDDRSQLQRAQLTILIETKTGTLVAPFLGRQTIHTLAA
jgi:hypothetical protein